MSYTLESNASHEPDGIPFAGKLLVCFLLLAGGESAVELTLWFVARPGLATVSYDPFAPNVPFTVLWVLIHFVLGGLLLLRSFWGRVWTQAIFVIHIGYVAQEIALYHPDIWVYLTPSGRLRLVLTIVLDVVAIAYLASAEGRRVFSR